MGNREGTCGLNDGWRSLEFDLPLYTVITPGTARKYPPGLKNEQKRIWQDIFNLDMNVRERVTGEMLELIHPCLNIFSVVIN